MGHKNSKSKKHNVVKVERFQGSNNNPGEAVCHVLIIETAKCGSRHYRYSTDTLSNRDSSNDTSISSGTNHI